MNYDESGIMDLIKVELCLEKQYYDQLLWLCEMINESDPAPMAEALLQVAIENTFNDPEQVDEWVKAFTDEV